MLQVLGGVKQRGQDFIYGEEAQIQGSIGLRTYVSKDAAV